jgi:hypothetical protein
VEAGGDRDPHSPGDESDGEECSPKVERPPVAFGHVRGRVARARRRFGYRTPEVAR